MDLLGPDIFCTLWMKEQVLHRERAHLKVPDWSLVWSVLLTKRLPMFLSRLNEISAGYEKIVLVSESFWSNLNFLRMVDLTAWLWGWNVKVNGMQSVFSFSAVCSADCRSILLGTVVARLNDRNRIATSIKKLAHCLRFFGKIRVVTTKRTKSQKLWKRSGVLDVWWMWRWVQQVTMWLCRFVVNTST